MNESTLHTPGDSTTPADDSINALLAQLTDPTALVACARARGAAGDVAGAVALCRKALTLSPGNAGALVTLGEACEAGHRWAEALAAYDEAIAAHPDCAEAYKRRGGVKFRLNDRLGAFDDLKHALTLRPDWADALSGELSNRNRQAAERPEDVTGQ